MFVNKRKRIDNGNVLIRFTMTKEMVDGWYSDDQLDDVAAVEASDYNV